MQFKKNRAIKVHEIYTHDKKVPQIRLQGQWLEELGFESGTAINVECLGGKLVITLKDEFICEVDRVADDYSEGGYECSR